MQALLGRLVIPVVVFILKTSLRWVLTQDHGKQLRNNLRAWWWKYRVKALQTPGGTDDAVAATVQGLLEFNHDPSGNLLLPPPPSTPVP